MKKLSFVLVLILLLCSLYACAPAAAPEAEVTPAAPAAAPATQAPAAPPAPSDAEVPDAVLSPVDAEPAAASGYAVGLPISAADLQTRLQSGAPCVVYFSGKKSSELETELQTNLADLCEEYADRFLCDYYAIPVADYADAKGILGGNLFGVVLFRPEGATLLCGDSKNDVSMAFNRFFEFDLVSPNDHGLPMVAYDELEEMIASGEPLLLYVGRDTCPHCRLFTPNFEAMLAELQPQTPAYYFYTQLYKTAIDNKMDGAEEEWDAIKASLGIEGTPSLLYFKDGTGTLFERYNTLFPNDAKSQQELDDADQYCRDALAAWFTENGIA